MDDSGKAIKFSKWATLEQDRAGWLKLVTKVPFDILAIGKPLLRPPRCDTRVTPEKNRRFLARRTQETEHRHVFFHAETGAEETYIWFQNLFINSLHLRIKRGLERSRSVKCCTSFSFSLGTSNLRFRLAQIACACTSARRIGFCVIWVKICPSSSSYPMALALSSSHPSPIYNI